MMENNQSAIRAELTQHLHGRGIEIGALHKPLPIDNPKVDLIQYVDRLPIEELRQHYPELNDLPLVEPEILDEGGELSSIPDQSLDFIIANHLFEHLENPLRALEIWCRKLRPKGVIYLAVPDKRFTFDKDRDLTSIGHLLYDYGAPPEERGELTHQHYVETAEIIEKRVGEDAQQRVESLESRNYSIHHHVWTYDSFLELLDYVIQERGIPLEIIDRSPPQPEGDEFIFILRKPRFQLIFQLRQIFRSLFKQLA